MVYSNTLPRFLIGVVLTASTAAYAECYTRSATLSKMASSIERIADSDRRVLPAGKGKNMCRITFRAYINGKWHNAQGEEIGKTTDSLDSICNKAMNAGKISILETAGTVRLTGNQEMICTDEPKKQQRAQVKIGDLVWESELQPHPVNKNVFNYRGSVCRWFAESQPQPGRIDLQQGIICRSPDQQIFKVVDKW